MSSPGVSPTQDDTTTRTDPVLVTVRLLSGTEVTGHVHVKPDSYHTRVSDMLNRGLADFLPITDATLERPDGHVTSTNCMIVRREQIEVVACIETSDPTGDAPRVEHTDTEPVAASDRPAAPAAPQMADSGARVAW